MEYRLVNAQLSYLEEEGNPASSRLLFTMSGLKCERQYGTVADLLTMINNLAPLNMKWVCNSQDSAGIVVYSSLEDARRGVVGTAIPHSTLVASIPPPTAQILRLYITMQKGPGFGTFLAQSSVAGGGFT